MMFRTRVVECRHGPEKLFYIVGYLFWKSVDSANKLAERMDRQDARK